MTGRPWTYIQATGELLDPDGNLVATGYSGHGAGYDNPAMEAVSDVGPVPVGRYQCGAPVEHIKLGPDAIPLVPFPSNEMFTRGGFYVHGDNAAHDRSASEGCIVLGPVTRARLIEGTVIEVVATRA